MPLRGLSFLAVLHRSCGNEKCKCSEMPFANVIRRKTAWQGTQLLTVVICVRTSRMGIKLIILLALLVGVLYSLHLLVKDYQALTAPKLLRFLFKRDVSSQYNLKPGVRWKAILSYDPVKCARYLYCDLGARPANNAIRRGFAFMLTLEPQKENRDAWEVFKQAYQFGQSLPPSRVEDCHQEYSMCPFHSRLLFDLIDYMVRNDYS